MANARTRLKAEWTPGRLALTGIVLVYVAGLLLLPLWGIGAHIFEGGFASVFSELLRPSALDGLKRTAILAAIAAVANGVLGVMLALVIVRQRFIGRWFIDSILDLPLALSPVMIGLSFLLVFGREGLLAGPLEALGIKIVFSFPGLILAVLFVTLPFTVREVINVLEELGTYEEQAAATLGASAWQTFWYVTLPNIKNSLTYGVMLTVARSLGEFGAVLVLGGAIEGKTQTATTFIYAAMEERMEGAAFATAIVLALISVFLLLLLETTKKRAKV